MDIYTCIVCNQKCITPSHRRRHERLRHHIQHEIVPTVCGVCLKKFKSTVNRNNHELLQHGIRQAHDKFQDTKLTQPECIKELPNVKINIQINNE